MCDPCSKCVIRDLNVWSVWSAVQHRRIIFFCKKDNKNTFTVKKKSFTSLFFKEWTLAIRPWSLFCKERRERFAHCRILKKSSESYSLTVALFKRGRRANRSRLLFKMSDFEQKSKERMSDRADSQPCTPIYIRISCANIVIFNLC